MVLTLLLSWLVAALAFAVVYGWARRIDNYGIVDVAWSAGFAPLAIAYALTGPAPGARRLVLACAVALWSMRLATHLAVRIARHHPREDGRYAQLRRDWGDALPRKMRLFFQGQALALVALAWPFLAISRNVAPAFSALEIAGGITVVLAVAGEALADAQLARFKATAPAGAVCDAGLWRYSRHPNYFFEWLVWVGFALAAWPAPGGVYAVGAPAVMLYLLLRVTGIRYTEEQLERSKGAAYRAYRRRTSAFVPWFPDAPPPSS